MVYHPRDTETIYESLKGRLTGKIAKLTNFVESGFNHVWAHDGFSEYWRRFEVALLAAQLSGYVDYAGGGITQSDLDELGIDNVDPEELNEFMDDEDLEHIGVQNGVYRDNGERATGTVTFSVASDTVSVPENTIVATNPDSDGDFYRFLTDEAVTPDSGETTVEASITADDVGVEYNVGSGQITYLPNPPGGVQSVSNTASTQGGKDEETNDELRSRIKNAISEKSGGGTLKGVEGYVESNTEATSVRVDDYPGGNASTPAEYDGPGGPGDDDSTSPFADVVSVGGEDSDIETAIEESRPVAIKHNLVRPTKYAVSVSLTVSGTDIDLDHAENQVVSYIENAELGEDIKKFKIVQRVMNADSDIEDIESIEISIVGEEHTFESGTDVYTLRKGSVLTDDGITSVTGTLNETSHTFTEDTDYQEGSNSIDWSLDGDDPDDGTTFNVTYMVDGDIVISDREIAETNQVNITTV